MSWRAIGLSVALAAAPACGVDSREPSVLQQGVDGGLGGAARGGSGGAGIAGASGAGGADAGAGGAGASGGGAGGGVSGEGGSGGACASGMKSCGGDVCISESECCQTCGPFEQCSEGSCSCIDGAFGAGCTGRFLGLPVVGVSDEDTDATAVSGNGRVIVGWSGSLGVSPPTQRAARWEWEAGSALNLGTLTDEQPTNPTSVATDVNENGGVIVGAASLVAFGITGEVPVEWLNNSLSRLELGEFISFGRAEAVSGQGATAAGWMASEGGALVGAVWSATALDGSSPYASPPDSVRFFAVSGPDAFGERASFPVDASSAGTFRTIPSGGLPGFVSAVSSGAEFLAGTLDGDQPVRWVGIGAGDPELLPGPGQAEDVSSDGTVVGSSGGSAVLWTSAGQRREVLDVLVEANATGISGWTLSSANGISNDGRVIAGSGTFAGRTRAWVARLPAGE